MEAKWKEEYSVGVKEIDDQHKHFIDLLNRICDAVGGNKSLAELEVLFQELAEYAKKHFATEEKYFDKFSYPEAEEHKLKHREMWQDVQDIRNMKDKDAIDFYGSVVYFLIEWLENHLEKEDQKYKECFSAHGLR